MAEAEFIDHETGEVMEGASIVQQHETASMDIQVATAQRLGRSIHDFQRDLEEWSCATQEIAEECTYVLKKGGSTIVGPSIRFAELLQQSYRHIVVDAFIEKEEYGFVVVGATARDLFRNTGVRTRVRRNILKKDGKTRYKQDVIQSTVQAAGSLALRNAIIRLVPKALWLPIWLKSRDVARGMDEAGKRVIPFREQVERAFAFLKSHTVSEQEILEHLGYSSRSDVTQDDLTMLRNKARAIRAGEVDPHEAFKPQQAEQSHGEAEASEVAERIKSEARKKAAKKPAKKQAKKAAKKSEPAPEEKPAEQEPAQESALDDDADEVPSVEL